MNRFAFALAISVGVPASGLAQGPSAPPEQPQLGAPIAPELLQPLPEIKGVVSWKTLGPRSSRSRSRTASCRSSPTAC